VRLENLSISICIIILHKNDTHTHTHTHTSDCEKKMFAQSFINSSRHKCMIDLKCRAHRKHSLNNVTTICEIMKFRIHDFVRQRIFYRGKIRIIQILSGENAWRIHSFFFFLLLQVCNNPKKSLNFLRKKILILSGFPKNCTGLLCIVSN